MEAIDIMLESNENKLLPKMYVEKVGVGLLKHIADQAKALKEANARLLAVARAAALHLAEADGVDQKIYNIRKLKEALAAVSDLL